MRKLTVLLSILLIAFAAQGQEPRSAQEYFERGNTRLRNGDNDGAIADYDKGLSLYPDHSSLLNNRGLARMNKGDLSGAMTDFDRAIKIGPDNVYFYDNRGLARGRSGNLAGALADFDKAIELDPSVPTPYIDRGNTLMMMERDLEKAIADFDKAIELGYRGPDIYKSRGVANYHKKNFAGAIAEYNKAIEVGARDAQVYGLRGLAWLWLSKDKEAEQDFARCFEMDASLRETYKETINDIKQKRASAAFKAFPNISNNEALTLLKQSLEEAEKSGKQDRNLGASLNNLAEFYSRTGSTTEAEHLFARALRVAKEIGDKRLEGAIFNNLGLLRLTQVKYDEALSYFQYALSLREKVYGPEHPEVAITLDNLGLAYGHKKEYAKAEELIKRSLAMLEKNRRMLEKKKSETLAGGDDVMIATRNLAILYKIQGRYTDAAAVYQRQFDSIEKEFGADFSRLNGLVSELISFYEETGERQKIEALIRRHLDILDKNSSPGYPDKIVMLTHFGDRLMEQNKYAEAEQYFRHALDFIDKGLEGKPPWQAIFAISRYAQLLYKTGRTGEVAALKERSSKLTEKWLPGRVP